MTRGLNKAEARRLAAEALEPLRTVTYEQLVFEYLEESHISLVYDRDGVEYNLEVSAMWDSRRERTVRVIACVDDGSVRWGIVNVAECDDFIIAPDGSFVGE